MNRTARALALLLSCSPMLAYADDKDRARELNVQATAAMDAGDLTTALARYREAYAAFPSPKLHFNIGLVLDKLGRRAEAADELQAFLHDVPNAPADTQKFARDKMAALTSDLGRMSVQCMPKAATLEVDAKPGACGESHFIEPGNHTIVVSATGFAAHREDVVIERAREKNVSVSLDSAPVATTPVVSVTESQPPSRVAAAPSKAAPIAVGVVSGAVLVAGIGLWAGEYAQLKHYEDQSRPYDSTVKHTQTLGGVGIGLTALGGIGAIVDVVLWVKYKKAQRAILAQ